MLDEEKRWKIERKWFCVLSVVIAGADKEIVKSFLIKIIKQRLID